MSLGNFCLLAHQTKSYLAKNLDTNMNGSEIVITQCLSVSYVCG